MQAKHLVTGANAEQQACEYLIKQGLQLITRNYDCKLGEIDLIMQDNQHLVFVEVRCRADVRFGTTLESVHQNKQRKIIRTALFYLQQQKLMDKVYCRFDVVGIEEDNKLTWVKDAFQVNY
jgi:putative endonuclease